jgi:AcrR family transcriptional regulator
LDTEGADALSTNRIAAVAGVSIGTLYQYFPDRQAIVAALVQRELEAIRRRVMESLGGPVPSEPGGRVRSVVRAVLEAFGGRASAQRLLLQDPSILSRALIPDALRAAVVELLASSGIVAHDRRLRKLPRAEAFVVVHAFVGVLRGLLVVPRCVPPRDVEDALVRLLLAFMVQ